MIKQIIFAHKCLRAIQQQQWNVLFINKISERIRRLDSTGAAEINIRYNYESAMKRQLWGELSKESDEAVLMKQIQLDQEIMMDKRGNDLN